MARTYDVKGTRDFLIWAVVLFGLGLWAVRDGWFPTDAKLEKYPQRVPLSFEIAGIVDEVSAAEKQEVQTGEILARLDNTLAKREMREVESALHNAPSENRENLVRLRRQLESAQAVVQQHTLRAPTNGVLSAVHIAPFDEVTPEDEVVVLAPRHHFYPFNKSLAILSLIGAAVCLAIHFKVR